MAAKDLKYGSKPGMAYARASIPWPQWAQAVCLLAAPDSLRMLPMTVDEAAYEMDLLDHDFFLYTDAATGAPALVHRLPQGGFAVSGGAGLHDQVTTSGAVLPRGGPPTLTEAQARERIEAGGEPVVFYLDAETGGARVLYTRYDGHYGLIETD